MRDFLISGKRMRRGFTLIELLVVISIIAVTAALLMPAVQSAREAARTAQCRNNLKQIGLATMAFETAFGELPAAAYGEPYNKRGPGGSAFTKLLPFLEQQQVADAYDWNHTLSNQI